MERTPKAAVWDAWVTRTVLADIRTGDTPDPVPMIDDTGPDLETTDAFDQYRYGRGDGEYLYLLYLLDEPVTGPEGLIPVYIGETNTITSRLHDHFKKIQSSLPIAEWADDGSWGSFSKYDHMAAVYERTGQPLYAWILDVETVEEGPYGYATYRNELEAKMVGLVHSDPRFDGIFANREFVPNRVPYEMAKVGPDWVTQAAGTPNEEARMVAAGTTEGLGEKTKAALWHAWAERTILQDIRDGDAADPIPLFETDDRGVVQHTDGILERTAAIDERIRREGKRCVHSDGVRDGQSGLLYVLYQLEGDTHSPDTEALIPRYIGKAEAYGKKNELSANFVEIAKDRTATRSFARWGDGTAWHVGELSRTITGEDSKKHIWATELFEQASRRLNDQTYLWIRAWDPERYPGPYGYPAYLAEVEALLIGLAYDAYPEHLLNHSGVPSDARVKQQTFRFEPVAE